LTFLTKRNVRTIMTAMQEPPIHHVEGDPDYYEKPVSVALVESCLFQKASWSNTFAEDFPSRGIQYIELDIFSQLKDDMNVHALKQMEAELASDLSSIPSVVLIARGPLPCLVAQYYLESLSLGGLVLEDPLLIPDTEMSNGTLVSSAETLIKMVSTYPSKNKKDSGRSKLATQELRVIEKLTSESTVNDQLIWKRPLRLEPGVVPMLILFSQEQFRSAATKTAAFHFQEQNSDNENITATNILNLNPEQVVDLISDRLEKDEL
jgi:hypothetical protein